MKTKAAIVVETGFKSFLGRLAICGDP